MKMRKVVLEGGEFEREAGTRSRDKGDGMKEEVYERGV